MNKPVGYVCNMNSLFRMFGFHNTGVGFRPISLEIENQNGELSDVAYFDIDTAKALMEQLKQAIQEAE